MQKFLSKFTSEWAELLKYTKEDYIAYHGPFLGVKMRVVSSKNSLNTGLQGIIIYQTAKTFKLLTKCGEKTIIKNCVILEPVGLEGHYSIGRYILSPFKRLIKYKHGR